MVCFLMLTWLRCVIAGSLAYGDSAELSLPAFEETCGGENPDWCQFYPNQCTQTQVSMAAPASGSADAKQIIEVDSPFAAVLNTFLQRTASTIGSTISPVDGGIERTMTAKRCPEVNGKRAPVCAGDAATRKQAPKVQTAAADTKSVYPGVAIIISGLQHHAVLGRVFQHVFSVSCALANLHMLLGVSAYAPYCATSLCFHASCAQRVLLREHVGRNLASQQIVLLCHTCAPANRPSTISSQNCPARLFVCCLFRSFLCHLQAR